MKKKRNEVLPQIQSSSGFILHHVMFNVELLIDDWC